MNKVLIVDRVNSLLITELNKKGLECDVRLDLDYDAYINLKDEYIGLIIRSRFQVDKAIIDSKKNLQFIVRIGSGMEHIDTVYAENAGVFCFSTPEGNAPSVAEHCLSMLLSATRNILKSDNEVRKGEWEREENKGMNLSSLAVGIIGFGHTGKAFAQLLKNFGCTIFVYDKYNFGFDEEYIQEVPLNTLLENSDVISLHVNYMTSNHHFFNEKMILKTKNPFILINTSRGLVVNTADVIHYLKKKRIRYACLDVLEYENTQLKIPPKSEWPKDLKKLSELPNTILTPHIAGQTLDAEKSHAEVALQKISRMLF